MNDLVRKRTWGFFRCLACYAFSRAHLTNCEHCGAKPRKKKSM